MNIPSHITPTIKIFMWIMFGIGIVVLVLSALILAGVRIPLEITRPKTVLLLFTSSVISVFTLPLATVHYRISKTHLKMNLAFIDILGGRIRLANILNIVIKEGKMYISYIWTGPDPVIAQIAIKPKHFEKMKNALMQSNPNIVYCNQDQPEQTEE